MANRVYDIVKAIPKGRVITYGQIACILGNKHLARAIGNVLHKNPDPQNIPCHRVVNCKGELSTSYAFGGYEAQRKRLEEEGIVFEGNGTVNLEKYSICSEDGMVFGKPLQ